MTDILLGPDESIELDVHEPDDVIELDLIDPDEIDFDMDVRTAFTSDHNQLLNRDLPDQHPISAITGLENELTDLSRDIGTESIRIDLLEMTKQDNLVSGTNIKTINGESILGPGDIETLNAAVSGATECLTLWYGQTV